MKKIFIIAVCVFCAVNVSAQYKINVQNGTKTQFYDTLETAIANAVAGDTLYLPGAILQVSGDIIIDKKLAIIGAGWDIDSIGGLIPTQLMVGGGYANLNFREGSSGSTITGCRLNRLWLGHHNEFNEPLQNIENITIARNLIVDLDLGVDRNNNQVKNIFIRENFFPNYRIDGFNATQCYVYNNLISHDWNVSIYNIHKSVISNNVIGGRINNNSECTFENNYIGITSSIIDGTTNSVFNNNAFAGNISFPDGSNNGTNNLFNQETIKTFVGNDLGHPKNLEVRDTSECKNAGTDGTDIGVYGGSTPYKPGAVPFHPHIDKFVVSPQADKDGNLKVDIQVSSQTR